MRKFLRLSFLSVFVFFSSWVHSKNYHSEVSVDTGYIPRLNSNRALAGFGLEFHALGGKTFNFVSDSVAGEFAAGRALWAFATYYLWDYPTSSWFLAYHEFGHGRALGAVGTQPAYGFTGGSASYNNIFSYFGSSLFTLRYGGFATGVAGWGTPSSLPSDWAGTITAGGVNNSMLFSEAIEEEIYFQDGHIVTSLAYRAGKLDAAHYVNSTQAGASFSGGIGDMANLRNFYQNQGYNISLDDIRNGHYLAAYASFSFWAHLWSVGRYVVKGDPTVESLEVGGLRLPDFSHYLMRRGLTLKANSGFQNGDRFFPVSFEYLYKGDTPKFEVGLGFREQKSAKGRLQKSYGFRVFINSHPSLSLKAHKSFSIAPDILLNLGAGYYHIDSFDGERHVPFINVGSAGYELWARLSWIL